MEDGKDRERMNIGEVEARTGMTRANIRFYESKGLLSPIRAGNDYRYYSEKDLASLLKIKLLRQLHVPIDDISRLQSGELALSDALSEKLSQLEADVAQRMTAAEICRDISTAGVGYDELDAPKYLSRITNASLAVPSFFTVRGDELPQAPHPWRRYFARSLDVLIYSLIWIVICSQLFRVNPLGQGFVRVLNFLIPYALMLIVEPVLLSTLGTTPGKWVFGLVLKTASGKKLTFSAAFDRILMVYRYGLGYLVIPIYSIYRLYVSYVACKKNELPWDEANAYTLTDKKPVRIAAFFLAHIIIYLLLLSVLLQAQMPRHRGDVTADEFAQNFNDLMDYYGLDYDKHLDNTGKWAENPPDNTYHLTILGPPPSDFDITETDGVVREIRYEMTRTDGQPISSFYLSEHMDVLNLAIRSCVCAQKGINIINQFSVLAPETKSFVGGFTYTKAGITVTCTTDYQGYDKAREDLLMPIENAQQYFHLVFSMEKTG